MLVSLLQVNCLICACEQWLKNKHKSALYESLEKIKSGVSLINQLKLIK